MDMEAEIKEFETLCSISSATRASQPQAHQHIPLAPDSRSEPASSQPASPAPISFLSLPLEIRNIIYKSELLVAHPFFLFRDTGSRVEIFAPQRPPRWLSLLYTNRQLYREACAVLYGMNHFWLVESPRQQVGLLPSFLNCIGSVNAGLLFHISINFPVTESVEKQPGTVKIRYDSLQSLNLLQEKCSNLKTLETILHCKNSSGLIRTDQDNLQLVREALWQIDALLKAISSLKNIIVSVYDGTLPPSTIESMQGLGWLVLPRNAIRGSGVS